MFVKNENFSNQVLFFFILFLKQECKKYQEFFKKCYTHIIMVANSYFKNNNKKNGQLI
jgi:hypothetical protein